jgi:hypothetical protein
VVPHYDHDDNHGAQQLVVLTRSVVVQQLVIEQLVVERPVTRGFAT